MTTGTTPAPAGRITVALDCAHERQSDAGVTRSTRSLARALEARDDVVVVRLGGGETLRRATVRKRLATVEQDLWWYPIRARQLARRCAADIYHCPTPRAPTTRGTPPLVVTIHDLASFRFPDTLTTWTRIYERRMLPRVAAAANLIITPSGDTADDVQSILHVPAKKIRIVPHGVDHHFRSYSEAPRPLEYRYVLFVGTPQPRKNLTRLASAVDLLRARESELRLVVAGSEGWGDISLMGKDVVSVGRVSDAEIPNLYRHAECVALVSLHEGFGLPALEAMAMGTPVLASNTAALPEVVGDAAVLVDPLDVEAIASGILEAISRKDELSAAGLRRSLSFSWEKAAEQTVAVYRELI